MSNDETPIKRISVKDMVGCTKSEPTSCPHTCLYCLRHGLVNKDDITTTEGSK